ncbi:MAG: Mth938-like domain-containing protein [Alphaproteobacteria bacterium]
MDITPLIPQGRQIIQSYKAGTFRISNETYDGPVIVFPERVARWDVSGMESLLASDFDILNTEKPDVILLGTGAKQIFLNTDMKKALKEKGLFIETMDTGAACRTFNVLMAEGRHVRVALIPI